MAQSDRWTLKVLSFPVFHDAFAKAILASPLADPAFVIALDADSTVDFLCKMSGLGEALDPSVFDVLMENSFLLEQFWSLIISSEKAFLSSTATQLGFGQCQNSAPLVVDSPIDKLRKEAAIKALVSKPMGECKKLKVDQPDPSNTPLLDKEQAERFKMGSKTGGHRPKSRAVSRSFLLFKINRMSYRLWK